MCVPADRSFNRVNCIQLPVIHIGMSGTHKFSVPEIPDTDQTAGSKATKCEINESKLL